MFVASRRRASLIVVLALAGAAAVPLVAYYQGHPMRIRYGLPLVAACAAIGAAGIAVLSRRCDRWPRPWSWGGP
jgi:peptidoglycan/LPS O-acetylase OafA/YrhL